MLNSVELEEIVDQAQEKIREEIFLANRMGNLDEILSQWGLSDLLIKQSAYDTEKNGKIVVVGSSEVKINVLLGIIKELNLDKNRFEFCLDYLDSKTFNYKKLQYCPKYRLVMFGPVPHSSTGKHDSSSVIAEMENKEGYPRILKLNGNRKLKITKSSFKHALEKMIEEDYI